MFFFLRVLWFSGGFLRVSLEFSVLFCQGFLELFFCVVFYGFLEFVLFVFVCVCWFSLVFF